MFESDKISLKTFIVLALVLMVSVFWAFDMGMTAERNVIFQEELSRNFSSYNVTVSDFINCPKNSECSGWTDEKGNIYILGNRTKAEIYETCNHEILHNILEIEDEENIVEWLDEYLHFPECGFIIK